jgi:ferrous iron transport protein A
VELTDLAYSARLMEMGVLPGSLVKLIRKAPFGCPLYLQVGPHFLAIREKEATHIVIAS